MQNWKTTLAGLATILIGIGNALAQLSSGHVDKVSLVAALVSGVGLVMARDAVRLDPAALPPKGFAKPWMLLALSVTCLLGCAAIRGASATVTVDGQSATVTVGKDGSGACTAYDPPITYMGETCSEICSAKTFPFINATCSSVTGVRHTVALVRVSP